MSRTSFICIFCNEQQLCGTIINPANDRQGSAKQPQMTHHHLLRCGRGRPLQHNPPMTCLMVQSEDRQGRPTTGHSAVSGTKPKSPAHRRRSAGFSCGNANNCLSNERRRFAAQLKTRLDNAVGSERPVFELFGQTRDRSLKKGPAMFRRRKRGMRSHASVREAAAVFVRRTVAVPCMAPDIFR